MSEQELETELTSLMNRPDIKLAQETIAHNLLVANDSGKIEIKDGKVTAERYQIGCDCGKG